LIAQYFRTIADVDGLVNKRVERVVGQFEHSPIGVFGAILAWTDLLPMVKT